MSALLEINLDKEYNLIGYKKPVKRGKKCSKYRKHLLIKDNKCHVCGCEDLEMTVDHVHSLGTGGTNDKSNLKLICNSCESYKKDRDGNLHHVMSLINCWDSKILARKSSTKRALKRAFYNINKTEFLTVINILPIV